MKKKYVYLICDPAQNKFKIGVTKHSIEKRIKELQTGNSCELHITSYYETYYPFCVERMLHNKYGHKNVLNEWFDLNVEDITSFKEKCLECENIIESMKENPFFQKYLK